MANQVIRFKNISKSYGSKIVINNISLDIEAGQFVTMLGTSGSGKTTLLKMVNRLVEPDNGSIEINNEKITDMNIIEFCKSIRANEDNSITPILVVSSDNQEQQQVKKVSYKKRNTFLFKSISFFLNICYN